MKIQNWEDEPWLDDEDGHPRTKKIPQKKKQGTPHNKTNNVRKARKNKMKQRELQAENYEEGEW